jgi:hypothetical protein
LLIIAAIAVHQWCPTALEFRPGKNSMLCHSRILLLARPMVWYGWQWRVVWKGEGRNNTCQKGLRRTSTPRQGQ